MESGPGAPPVQSDILVEKGGKAGIWQGLFVSRDIVNMLTAKTGGMGLAVDGNRIFLATG